MGKNITHEKPTTGVHVPEEVVRQSEEKKQQHRTVRQTQVYRDVANLKYLIVRHMSNAPRKYAKYFDGMLVTVSNAKQSLFTSSTGEPIGNLTTQLFANFLMSFFVAYVQFIFRRKRFDMAQFVDDFVLVCDDLRFLVDSIPLLEAFLRDKLLLMLHKDKRYLQPVTHGVLFVGTMIKPARLYLSNRTLSRMTEKCNGFREILNDMTTDVLPDLATLEHIEQVVNSYLGFTLRKQTYNFRTSVIDSMGDAFWCYFVVRGHYESIRLKRQYRMIHV